MKEGSLVESVKTLGTTYLKFADVFSSHWINKIPELLLFFFLVIMFSGGNSLTACKLQSYFQLSLFSKVILNSEYNFLFVLFSLVLVKWFKKRTTSFPTKRFFC